MSTVERETDELKVQRDELILFRNAPTTSKPKEIAIRGRIAAIDNCLQHPMFPCMRSCWWGGKHVVDQGIKEAGVSNSFFAQSFERNMRQGPLRQKMSRSGDHKILNKAHFASKYGVDPDSFKCMISGVSLTSLAAVAPFGSPALRNPVTLSYLFSRCANDREMSFLGYNDSDKDNIRNTILLCKGFKEAYYRKYISFVPSEKPFSGCQYKLHIWNNCIRNQPIYEGAGDVIGSFEGAALDLEVGNSQTFHNPFNRAFRAFRACKMWHRTDLPEDSDNNSVYQRGYKAMRRRYADQLARAIQDDEDAADEEEVAVDYEEYDAASDADDEDEDYPVDGEEDAEGSDENDVWDAESFYNL
eukprot:gene10636-22203_t